jgi:uncharacterized protein
MTEPMQEVSTLPGVPAESGVVDDVVDGAERPLDPRHVILEREVGYIVTAVIGLLALAFTLTLPAWTRLDRSDIPWLLAFWAAFTALLGWFDYYWPVVEHRFASYRFTDDLVQIKRGVYWRSLISVPRSRVQHTDVTQGPLERRHGLGTLVVFTAGMLHARVQLPGLAYDDALRIRDHLLPARSADAV